MRQHSQSVELFVIGVRSPSREGFPSTVSVPVRSGQLWGRKRSIQLELTFGINPVGIEIGQRSLITDMLHGFGGFLVDDAAGPPTAALPLGVGR